MRRFALGKELLQPYSMALRGVLDVSSKTAKKSQETRRVSFCASMQKRYEIHFQKVELQRFPRRMSDQQVRQNNSSFGITVCDR